MVTKGVSSEGFESIKLYRIEISDLFVCFLFLFFGKKRATREGVCGGYWKTVVGQVVGRKMADGQDHSDEGPDTAGDGEAKWAVDVSVGMWKFQKVGTVAKEINVK